MTDNTPSGLGPVLRRYWLCGAESLDAIGAAIDPPDWEDPAIPMAIVALDARAHALCANGPALDHIRLIDASETEDFAGLIERLIGNDHASHIQLCLHAVADFGPAIELLVERLESSEASMVRGRIAEVGEVATRLDASANLPEGAWTGARLLRQALAETPLDRPTSDALSALLARASRLASPIDDTALMLGARFVGIAPTATEVECEALRWRARAARAFARTDWLEVDERHRWLRELAVRGKMARRAQRQNAQLREEVAVLHAQLGAPWSAARFRLRSKQVRRSRLLKAFRRWS